MNEPTVEMVRKDNGHRLSVDLSELEFALDNVSYEQMYVLDVETGEVLWNTTDESSQVEEILGEIEDVGDDPWAAFEAALAQRNLADWEVESLRQAARIEEGFGTRFRRIDRSDPHAGYRDMEAFIDTVGDAILQRDLERAISGRGAFRRFKDVLPDHPAERDRWFDFQGARLRERALEWLKEEGFEPVAE